MIDYEGFRKVGKFTLDSGVEVFGELSLKGMEITDLVGEHFPEIELVLDQAVDCRNYYVHVTETKIDYSRNAGQLIFLTDTLEFFFVVSDLVESGWDIAAWIEQRPFHTHPFGRYVVSYRERLEVLKKLLAEKV
ncbi:MAG: hypothetical protein D3914_08245 [Candidatus Electrothrix sp. LOE2]|nr:hypothetical protein [Candidatus Electrothrix sp. LOE2]